MPRVRGRRGSSRFRTSAGWWENPAGGPPGSAAMTRLAVIQLTDELTTQGGTVTPVWSRFDTVNNDGWNVDFIDENVRARAGTTGALATALGTTVVLPGKVITIGLTVGIGTLNVFLNGALETFAFLAAAYEAGGDHLVGVDEQPTPTVAGLGVRVYALIGSDTVAVPASSLDPLVVTFPKLHAEVVDRLQQGRSLSDPVLFTGHDRLWDGRDASTTLNASAVPTWIDELASDTLTADQGVAPPEPVFAAMRF